MLLCCDQAAETELPIVPPRRENLYMVPQGIRPVVQLTAIEVMHKACHQHYPFSVGLN